MGIFIMHARTPEEAVKEFVSDLERQISILENRAKGTQKRGELDKIKYCLAEFRAIRNFWVEVEVERPRRKRS